MRTNAEIETLLTEIEVREKKATPGNWQMWGGGGFVSIGVNQPCVIADKKLGASYGDGWNQNSSNYDFMAHARTDIPALVKLVRELLQQVAKIAIPLEAMFIYGNEASLSPAMADGLRKARDIARSIALTGVPQEDK